MAIVRWEPFRLFPRWWGRWPSLWDDENELPEEVIRAEKVINKNPQSQ